jgi:hypothetical protein
MWSCSDTAVSEEHTASMFNLLQKTTTKVEKVYLCTEYTEYTFSAVLHSSLVMILIHITHDHIPGTTNQRYRHDTTRNKKVIFSLKFHRIIYIYILLLNIRRV